MFTRAKIFPLQYEHYFKYRIMSSVNRGILNSFLVFISSLSVSCFIFLAKTLSTLLKSRTGSRHPWLVADFIGNITELQQQTQSSTGTKAHRPTHGTELGTQKQTDKATDTFFLNNIKSYSEKSQLNTWCWIASYRRIELNRYH